MICVGVYNIIGTAFEFKHILVSLQLTIHSPFRNINPRRSFTKSEKKEYIAVGVIFAILGVAIVSIFTLIKLKVF